MMIFPIKALRPTRCRRTKKSAAVGLFGVKHWHSLKQKQTCLLNSWVFNCYIICLPPCTFGSFGHISRILTNITNGEHVHYLRRFGATKASRKFRRENQRNGAHPHSGANSETNNGQESLKEHLFKTSSMSMSNRSRNVGNEQISKQSKNM